MTTKSVLKLLEGNRNTLISLQNVGSNQSMDLQQQQQLRPIHEIVESILEQEQWKNQRASKLDLDDFLQLLAEFNQAGIHFS